MNQCVVPQFIDVEAKIIGPVTVRQFVLTLVGGFIAVLSYKFADTGLFIILLLIDGAFVGLFGFFKVNGRSFHLFLFNVFDTLKRPSIRAWMSREAENISLASTKPEDSEKDDSGDIQEKKELTQSRLQELSLVVDTGGVYRTNE